MQNTTSAALLPESRRDAPTLIVADVSRERMPPIAQGDVGQLRHEDAPHVDEQWLRDLEVLGRIEEQRECFFDDIGALHAAAMGRAK